MAGVWGSEGGPDLWVSLMDGGMGGKGLSTHLRGRRT